MNYAPSLLPPPAGFAAINTVKRGVTNTLYYGMALFLGFGMMILLQGLKADERVAVQGAGFLNEGDLVKVAQ